MRPLDVEEKFSLEKGLQIIFSLFLIIPLAVNLLFARFLSAISYAIYLFADKFIDVYGRIVQQDLSLAIKNLLRLHLVLHAFVGHFLRFYDLVPFWDKLLHFFGCFAIACFFHHTLLHDSKFWRALGTRLAILTAFLLANFSGVLWEVAEFFADKIFSVNAQRGLDDTMFDLIFNVFGSYFGVRLAKRLSKESEPCEISEKMP